MKRYLPWIVTGVFALWVLAALRPPRPASDFDLVGFGRLPVVLNGRVQPFDSVARNSLLQIRTRQAYAEVSRPDAPWWNPGAKYTRMSALEWLLELMTRPEQADQRKVFRIDHPELRTLLGLPPEGPFYHAQSELRPHFEEIEKQARQAGALDPAQRNTFQKAVFKLFQNLVLYQRLKNTLQPEGVTNFLAELQAYQAALEPGLAAVTKHEAGEPHDAAALDTLVRFARRFETLSQAALPLIVPPIHPETDRDAWANVGASLMETLVTRQIHPAVLAYAEMAGAYAAGRPGEFNQALARLQQWLAAKGLDREIAKGRWEFLYNQWRPFYLGTTLYVVAFLLGCVSWLSPTRAGVWNRSGYGLLGLGLAVHTAGILFRMALEGRPPVTNLYSSAVFVGWGAVALGVILERIHRDSVGLVMAATVGCITLIIAHNLALGGDTMEMMRAVLDSNFWLTTHVITITLGYSATFAAGFLAIMYVLRGLFTRGLTAPSRAALNRMVYGILCFATLFSFVGTVLGGIWADQSWGRFWGWDPKENGALIIVLWNALILHARWGGLVGERGLMNLAIFGNIVTSFSWFGVNMLGVGLHSYGFMDAAFFWLMLFVVSQLLLIGLGSLPLRYWASLRAEPPAQPAPVPAG
jgi:ABC-type transport system involved in cytochrome c biogenesis permease subunit